MWFINYAIASQPNKCRWGFCELHYGPGLHFFQFCFLCPSENIWIANAQCRRLWPPGFNTTWAYVYIKNKVVTRFKARNILGRYEQVRHLSAVLFCARICRGRATESKNYETFRAFTTSKLNLNRNNQKGLICESKYEYGVNFLYRT
jgi:hypothetical protein